MTLQQFLYTLAVAVLGPAALRTIGTWVKRRSSAKIDAANVEMRRIDTAHEMTGIILDRQAQEIADLKAQIREQRVEMAALDDQMHELEKRSLRRDQGFDQVLGTLVGLAWKVREGLVRREPHEHILPLAQEIVDAAQGARQRLFNGTEKR